MTIETKAKLKKLGVDATVADVLEAAGILLPKDIKLADNDDLLAAGLSVEEVAELRARFPAFES